MIRFQPEHVSISTNTLLIIIPPSHIFFAFSLIPCLHCSLSYFIWNSEQERIKIYSCIEHALDEAERSSMSVVSLLLSSWANVCMTFALNLSVKLERECKINADFILTRSNRNNHKPVLLGCLKSLNSIFSYLDSRNWSKWCRLILVKFKNVLSWTLYVRNMITNVWKVDLKYILNLFQTSPRYGRYLFIFNIRYKQMCYRLRIFSLILFYN